MADFGGADLDAFRTEAREWLEANFPPSLKGRGGMMFLEGRGDAGGDVGLWKQRMGEKGWGVPTWPKAYGGGGLEPAQARVLQQEMNRVGAWNPIGGMGVMMFGPTLLEYGNEEQKKAHIPPIVHGEVRWCQGFSEPGAGSDLASLQTQAARTRATTGWSTARRSGPRARQWADMCFCLVRTDSAKKHEGISFLLIDMKAPGVEVRPIQLIAGASPFCETFFTDVKVPKENLVGPLNGGWTIAKRLLQHERSGLSGGGGGGGGGGMFGVGGSRAGSGQDLRRRRRQGPDRRFRPADPHLGHDMERRAFQLTAIRMMTEARSNQGPSTATSIMKNAGTKVGQDRAELLSRSWAPRASAGRATTLPPTSWPPCAAGWAARPPPSSAARTRSRTTSSPSGSWAFRTRSTALQTRDELKWPF